MPAVEDPLSPTTEPPELSDEAKLRGLPWQLAQNVLNAVFASLTVFGSVFLLFLDELGLPKTQIGLLLSLMPFAGLLALWSSPVATRLGRRRVFLVCWAARKAVVAGLLLLPWVMDRYGHTAGLMYLTGIIALFSVLRSIAETAWYPWYQEVIPNRLRGRFGANSTVLTTVFTCIAVVVAGRVLKASEGLDGFLLLIGVGCCIGLIGTALMIPVPGGEPLPDAGARRSHLANMLVCLRDGNFVYYLAGVGFVTLGVMAYLSFLPLFLKDRLGLAPGTVVTMETAVMIGSALSALLWGRAADRVGSRPVLMVAAALTLLVPLGWLLLPRQTPHLLLLCGLLYFLHGMALIGCSMGAGRLLLNGVVPPPQSTAYMALYYAWQGLVGGAAPLLAGALLQAYEPWEGHCAWFTLDGHAVLFILAAVLIALGWACHARVRPDDRYRTRDVLHALTDRLFHRLR